MQVHSKIWYAVRTRPRWEKKVAGFLQDQGHEYYCPLNKLTRIWSDRKKIILEPLFKGYVFVKVDHDRKWDLMKISGIINYVNWLGKPARIRDEEIDTIRRFMHEFSEVEVVDGVLAVNNMVRIRQGVLMNYRGILLELNGNRARVRIESMGLQLSACFDRKNIEAISPEFCTVNNDAYKTVETGGGQQVRISSN